MKMNWAALIAVLAAVGCGDSGSGKNEGNSSGNPVTAPVDYLGAVSKAKTTAENVADGATLKQAILMFKAEEERLPKTLEELVEKKYLPALPKPAYGTRMVYNPETGAVTFVKQ